MEDVFDVLAEDHEEIRQALAELEKGPTAATGASEDQLMLPLTAPVPPFPGAGTAVLCSGTGALGCADTEELAAGW